MSTAMKAWEKEKNKGDNEITLENQMIEAAVYFSRGKTVPESVSKKMTHAKSQGRTYCQGNTGVNKTRPGAEEISAEKTGGLARHRRKENLEYLQNHEHERGEIPVG